MIKVQVTVRDMARLCAPAAVVLLLAACQTPASQAPAPQPLPAPVVAAPPPPPAAPRFTATPGLTVRERIRRALDLLSQGMADQARPEVAAVLAEQPDNDIAKSLLDQIDKDPKVLLGEQSFSYTIRQGETISMLADRYLGDRLLFWALARYNNLAVPGSAEVGQTIQIPGEPRAAAAPRRRSQSEEALIQNSLGASKPAARPAPSPPPSPLASRDPGKARQLRASALELLNRGTVDRAVALLEQALRLDPGNALISKDLARAKRLQGVHR